MPYHFNRWRDTLYLAPTERAVHEMLGDYVNTLTPEALAGLSEECRRVLVARPLEIQAAAVTLMHAELAFRGDPKVGELLHELAHTFAAASIRITNLHNREPIAE